MKIIFFGSPSAALPSLNKIIEAGHKIELIITQPDKPAGRGKSLMPSPVKKMALKLNIPFYQPTKIKKDPDAQEKITVSQPDINVVVAYGQIIPSSIIYLPKYNSVNLHFSHLPKYRGASPVQWALLSGDKKTGVSIFELNERMDEGGILAQEEVDIDPQENAGELEERLAQIGANLLVKTIEHIDEIKPSEQDHSEATYAPKINKEDGRINWTKDAFSVENQVKAFTPRPSAHTFLGEMRIKILRGRKIINEVNPSTAPGEIFKVSKVGIEVCCGNGTIYLIQTLQPENRKGMDAYAFSLGAKMKIGDKLV